MSQLRVSIFRIFITSLLVFSSTVAFAQKKKPKKTVVNFEDQLIEGELQKPELFYLLQKKQFNFSRLIKFRENFVDEMNKTANDVPRGSEGN